jgi:hypothetical protein
MTCTTNNGYTPSGTAGSHCAPFNTGVGQTPGFVGTTGNHPTGTGYPTGNTFPTGAYPTGNNPFSPYFSTQSFWPTGAFTGPSTGEPFGTPSFWQAFQAFCAWTNAQNSVNGNFTPWFNQFPGFTGSVTGNVTGQNTPWFGNQGVTPSFFGGFNPFFAQNTFGQNFSPTFGNTFGNTYGQNFSPTFGNTFGTPNFFNGFTNGYNNGFTPFFGQNTFNGFTNGFNPSAFGFNTNATPFFGVTPWNFNSFGNVYGQPVNPAFFAQFFTPGFNSTFGPNFTNTAFWNQNVPYGYATQNTQNFRGLGLAA